MIHHGERPPTDDFANVPHGNRHRQLRGNPPRSGGWPNLFADDPNDTGISDVDIYKMNTGGKAIEHWDALRVIGDAKDSAPLIAPNIRRTNASGMS
jgi:hypothetical protein